MSGFDDVLGKAEEPKQKAKPKAKKPELKARKVSYSAMIDESILERVRDAAYFIPGLTVSEIFSQGAKMFLDAHEKESGAIPKRSPEQVVKTGRPGS